MHTGQGLLEKEWPEGCRILPHEAGHDGEGRQAGNRGQARRGNDDDDGSDHGRQGSREASHYNRTSGNASGSQGPVIGAQ